VGTKRKNMENSSWKGQDKIRFWGEIPIAPCH